MEKVNSSLVAAIGYDPATKALEVMFKSGRVYRYQGVALDTFDALTEAKSKGQFVVEHIVHGGYKHEELDQK